MTSESLVIVRDIPGVRNISQNMLIAIIAVVSALVLFIFFIILFLISDVIKIEKKEHKMPDSHRLILDLQKTMVKEMRGTTTQNWIMIFLTVIFILVTVFGGGIFTVLYKHIKGTMHLFLPKVIKQILSLMGK